MAISWLEALSAPQLDILINGWHFVGAQTMDEEVSQEIRYQGHFGTDLHNIRSQRRADEGTVSFTAILLVPGQQAGMDDESILYKVDDVNAECKRGKYSYRYLGGAWRTIRVNSTLDQVTLNADLSFPGNQFGKLADTRFQEQAASAGPAAGPSGPSIYNPALGPPGFTG